MAAGGHIEQQMKVAFRSNKMVRNENENEFRTSKMAADTHFEKKESYILVRNVPSVHHALSGITSGAPFFIESLSYTFLYNIQGRGTSYILLSMTSTFIPS